MKNKTNDIRHELLSELHYLLSIASAEDFIDASRLCKSENIKVALEALAKEHTIEGPGQTEPAFNTKTLKRKVTRISSGTNVKASDIQAMFLDKTRFAKKQDIVDFAKANGIAIKVGDKESRERVAFKLVKLIAASSGEKQKSIQNRISEGLDSQTAGWARVIKQPK